MVSYLQSGIECFDKFNVLVFIALILFSLFALTLVFFAKWSLVSVTSLNHIILNLPCDIHPEYN